jgi:hypothetical protein
VQRLIGCAVGQGRGGGAEWVPRSNGVMAPVNGVTTNSCVHASLGVLWRGVAGRMMGG